jgi:hypothetical protein
MDSVFDTAQRFLAWCLAALVSLFHGLMVLAVIWSVVMVIHAGWLFGVDFYLMLARPW